MDEHGHEVFSAGTPQGAIALLEKAPHVDVLFTDLDLKGDIHAGIELARRAVHRWPCLKVIYTTGRFDGWNEGPLCHELGISGEALHGGRITYDPLRAF